MRTRSDKEREVESLRRLFSDTPHVFVGGFEKLTVEQDFQLRKTVREAGGIYKVVKNNLAEKAAAGTQAEHAIHGLVGMTSLAYTSSDPVALAKALTGYAKINPTFVFKAGVVEGRVIAVDSIRDLATMPSREEMFSRLLYMINAPAQRLLSAVQGVGRNLAVVLNQGVEKEKFSA